MKKGATVLGSVIGSETECKTFEEIQLEELQNEKNSTRPRKHHQKKVYSCYTKRVQEKLSFLAKTTIIPCKTCRPARRYCRKFLFQI